MQPAYNRVVADVVFVLTIVTFFAFAAFFVRACDRILGVDDEVLVNAPGAADAEQLAA